MQDMTPNALPLACGKQLSRYVLLKALRDADLAARGAIGHYDFAILNRFLSSALRGGNFDPRADLIM